MVYFFSTFHINELKSSTLLSALLSATPKIRNEGGVPLLFIKRSDVGVTLLFFKESKNMSNRCFPLLFILVSTIKNWIISLL